ncbi:MAG: division/cell wall cluster transcriptional repressor MraZ [Deltaproteobacteria bacterium]|nr:division/cell wall cluster transcriptional repressor MraZ [Deltaproteobacteria bacterium]
MFRGRFVHTIDPKGRMSIPLGFRTEVARRGEHPPILTNLKDCLALYVREDFLEIERRLCSTSPLQLDVQSLQRFIVSGASDCPFDAQGRILVPPHLREHARLERDVVVAGVGPRIELWDKHRFDQELAQTQAQFAQIANSAVERGV